MNIAQAKCIPIPAYLAKHGHNPKLSKHAGRELWYHSPIRNDDDNPSFKVDTIKNLWYDHGLATGGTIVDLVCDMASCGIRDALQHLDKSGLFSPALATPQMSEPTKTTKSTTTRRASRGKDDVVGNSVPARKKEKSGPLELIKTSPLTHPALLQYLTKRNIDHKIASEYVSQIDFKGSQGRGTYFGVGFPSGSGYEVRNALFKGFVGTNKTISFIDQPESRKLIIFEGFMDFLSLLSYRRNPNPEASVLVLNSTNLWRHAQHHIESPQFEEIALFLDNGSAGDAVTEKFQNANTTAKIADMRELYSAYDDFNAWWMDQRV
jgi:hypothetical protein